MNTSCTATDCGFEQSTPWRSAPAGRASFSVLNAAKRHVIQTGHPVRVTYGQGNTDLLTLSCTRCGATVPAPGVCDPCTFARLED